MHARVSTYQGRGDELVTGFDRVKDQLRGVDGFVEAYFLVDRDEGRAMSITFWDSEEAMGASADAARRLREEGTQPAGASVESVAGYEVALAVSGPAASS